MALPQAVKNISRTLTTHMSSSASTPVVAVLFQAIDPPVINGVRKPRKPGGYQDSGADIACALQTNGIKVLTPSATPPNPATPTGEGWCFPDTEEGIWAAVQQGATHLWANTILFSSHPLQTSSRLRGDEYESFLRVVGQPPGLVEDFDDKAYLNGKLDEIGEFTLPRSWIVDGGRGEEWRAVLESITDEQFPIVGKPVRGRGSHGVKVCWDRVQLRMHVEALFEESPVVMLEEFLAGEEATITVMPPLKEGRGEDGEGVRPRYWSLPPVRRFNHTDGIAPYNGTVAVTRNSRVVTRDALERDASYGAVMRECERVAELIGAAAPIRVDVRRFREGSEFALFDINMKPNMTGPGRPGRDDQASLTAMAAAAIGWDYATLLQNILAGSQTLGSFRRYRSPFR